MKSIRMKNGTIFHFAFGLMLLFGFFHGCETDRELADPAPMHKDYIHLDSGMTFIYEADSFYYDNFNNTIDTYEYTVGEQVVKRLDSNQFMMKREVRGNGEGVKERSNLFTAKITQNQYQVLNDNQRIIKLTFPVREKKSWDGNAFNREEARDFYYKNVHQRFKTNYLTFDSTTTVVELDAGNLIEQERKKVVYAKGIGKVYKERLNLRFKGDSIPPKAIPWEQKANTGHIIREELKKYHLP